MNKKQLFALIILFISVLCLFWYCNRPVKQSTEPSIEEKIDSIFIVRDSILEKIDTLYIELENNNKQYEKDLDIVINNTPSADLCFFYNYLNANKARLDSLCNSSRY